MRTLGLKWRVLAPLGTILTVGIVVIVFIIARRYATTVTDLAMENLAATSINNAEHIKKGMDISFATVKSLATVLESSSGSLRADRDHYNGIMENVLRQSDQCFGIWVVFEPDRFDGRDAEFAEISPFVEAKGRYAPYHFKQAGGSVGYENLHDFDTPGVGDYYINIRNSTSEGLTSPYHDTAGGKPVFVFSVAMPLMKEQKFIGAIGADMLVDPICDFMAGISVNDSGYAMLVDYDGNLVYHPQRTAWGRPVREVVGRELADAIRTSLLSGIPQTLEGAVTPESPACYSLLPFSIAQTGHRWLMISVAPNDEIMAPVTRGVTIIIVAGAALLMVSLAAQYLLVSSIVRALMEINTETMAEAATVAREANFVTGTSMAIAEDATEQASSLGKISSALQEIQSITSQTAENAARTKQASVRNSDIVARGGDAIREMNQAMAEINDSASQIGKIISSIEGIAFKTNLLAINAAVEAARAGDAGMGFAVVAEEVRRLSGDSAKSVQETTGLIQLTVERVHRGVALAENLMRSFGEIETESGMTTVLIGQISEANREQAVGVRQINNAVSEVEQLTQQNAVNSENAVSSARNLNYQSEYLRVLVVRMAVLLFGRKAKPANLVEEEVPVQIMDNE